MTLSTRWIIRQQEELTNMRWMTSIDPPSMSHDERGFDESIGLALKYLESELKTREATSVASEENES